MKFDGIKFESLYSESTIDVNILIRPAHSEDIAIPEGKGVNLLTMTEGELTDLARKVTKLGF